ncbi:MAG: hypothetical protein U0414_21055 [Polyangiaceae bacterium]
MSRGAAWLLAVIGASALPRETLAQDPEPTPSVDLRGYRNPVDARAGLYVEPATTPDTGEFSGGVRFNYAFRPIVLHDAAGDRKFSVIEHQLTADLYASVGLWKRLSIGFDLPAIVAQAGDDPASDPAAAKIVGTHVLPTTAIGDPGLVVKGTFVKPAAENRGAAIGLMNRLTLPLGDPSSFIGEGAVTDEIRALLDAHFAGYFTVHLTAGVKLRTDTSTGEDSPQFGCIGRIAVCDSRFGHELLWGGGFEMDTAIFKLPHTSIFAELRGYLPIAPVAAFDSRLPAGTFASISHRVDVRDVSFFMGHEFALDSGVGNAPYRLTIGMSFTPRNRDRDRDGIDDDKDRCPDRAEDLDGKDDSDGCPEADGVPVVECDVEEAAHDKVPSAPPAKANDKAPDGKAPADKRSDGDNPTDKAPGDTAPDPAK